jgi:hypothetical protein
MQYRVPWCTEPSNKTFDTSDQRAEFLDGGVEVSVGCVFRDPSGALDVECPGEASARGFLGLAGGVSNSTLTSCSGK